MASAPSAARRVILGGSQGMESEREGSRPNRAPWDARGRLVESPGRCRVKAHQREGPAPLSSRVDEWYEVTSDGRCAEGPSSCAEDWRWCVEPSAGGGGASSLGEGGSSRAHGGAVTTVLRAGGGGRLALRTLCDWDLENVEADEAERSGDRPSLADDMGGLAAGAGGEEKSGGDG